MASTPPVGSGRHAGNAAHAAHWARPSTLRLPVFRLLPWLGACVAAEVAQRRLFPWIAVAYGVGVALAFAADGPLSLWPPLLAGGLCTAGAVAARAHPGRLALLIGCAATSFGFASAVRRMDGVAAPVLARQVIGSIEGFVESVEERGAGGRLVLRLTKLDRLDAAARPGRVRVSVRALGGTKPGDYVAATARLLPPPEAARPDGYDFARDSYFRGIGAVGSVSGRLRVVLPPPAGPPLDLAVAALVDRARNALTSRIAGTIGGQPGAVAAALITGKRGLIDDHSNDILRAAGIYHIVSISGLHMVLAAGVFFWMTRALLALSPTLALSWPIKKIAAVAGMVGATAYDVFSGSDVATERSLLMILVMQGAILFDRPALSLRNLALSALIVLTREPETLLGPSLQMSYAAVAGLIALAEWLRRRGAPGEPGGPVNRAVRWAVLAAVGTVATTVVASFATAPFGTFHFQNVQPYGVIGNAATLPLVSIVVMPCAVIGTILYPFGLDRPVWWVMGLGVDLVLALSEWVAGIPGSVVIVPAFGPGALICLVVAILAGTLFVSGLRWLALLPAGLGILAAWTSTRPDIYVARDGSGAAIRAGDGRLVVVGRVGSFTAEQWLRADGDGRRASEPSVRAGARCDRIGCTVVLRDGRAVSFLDDRRGFAVDCGRAAVVLSRFAAPSGCAALAIDRQVLASGGAVALRATKPGFAVTTARQPGDAHPWIPGSGPRPAATAAPPPAAPPPPDDPPDLPSAEPPDGGEP